MPSRRVDGAGTKATSKCAKSQPNQKGWQKWALLN
jgi:hypothetical protein